MSAPNSPRKKETSEEADARLVKHHIELQSLIDKGVKAAAERGITLPVYNGSCPVDEWQRDIMLLATINDLSWLFSKPALARVSYERFVDPLVKKRIFISLPVNAELKETYANGACDADAYLKCLKLVQFRAPVKSIVEIARRITDLTYIEVLEDAPSIIDGFVQDLKAWKEASSDDTIAVEILREKLFGQTRREAFDEHVALRYPGSKPKRSHILTYIMEDSRAKFENSRIKETAGSHPKAAAASDSPAKPRRAPQSAPATPAPAPKAPATTPPKPSSPPAPSGGPSSRTRSKWKPGDPYHGGLCYACQWAEKNGKGAKFEGGKHPAGEHCPYYAEWDKLPQAEKFPASSKPKEGSTAMLATISEGIFVAATLHLDKGSVMQPVMLDTGAGPNLISAAFVDEHNLPTRAGPPMHLAGLSTIVTHRMVDLSLSLVKQDRHVSFYVVPQLPTPLLIGQRYMRSSAIDVMNSTQTVIIGAEGSVPFVPASLPEAEREPALATALIAQEVAHPDVLHLPMESSVAHSPLSKPLGGPELLRAFSKEPLSLSPGLLAEGSSLGQQVNINPKLPQADREKIAATVDSKPDAWFDTEAPGTLGQAKGVTFTIPMDPETEKRPPVLPRGYRISPADWAIIAAWLRESLRLGRVGPASVALFLSRLVVVRTRDENGNLKIRICLDLRVVNSHTLKLPYPQRHPFEVLTELSGYDLLGSVDLRASFEQLALAEDDRRKACFWFDGQLYNWLVMPFGALNAPFVMQRVIDQALAPVRDIARALIDDILLTVKGGVDEYCVALGRVLDCLIAFNLRGALSKAKLGYPTLPALGHVVSGLGVAIPDHKVRAIRDLAAPTDAKAAISVLAGFQFYRRFIPGFSEIVKPIHDVTLPGATWTWGPAQEEAWADIKRRFTEAPILRHPVPGKPVYVRSDASGYAIAAVFLQPFENDDGKEILLPIAYWSRKLSKAECGRSATDLELLAADEAFQEGRYLLHGAPLVTLESDHFALEYILKGEEFANDRLKRSVMRMQELYPFKCVHRKGKSPQMGLADAMSRDAQYLKDEPAHDIDFASALVVSSAVAIPTIAEAQKADATIASLVEAVTKDCAASIPEAEALRQEFKEQLHVRDGILLHVANRRGRYVARRFIPAALRQHIVETCHREAHLRGESLYTRVLTQYFWPGALKDIDRISSNCIVCAEVNATHQRLTGYMHARQVGYPGQALWFDYVDMPTSKDGYVGVLTAYDIFDTHCYAVPVRSKDLETTVDAIISIICDNDPPKEWGTDNAPQFLAEGLQEAARLLGINPRTIPAYLPRANPDERLNRELVDLLTKLASSEPLRWPFYIPFVIRGIRTAPRDILNGLSAYQLRRGRQPISVLDRQLGIEPEPMRVVDYADNIAYEVVKGIKIAHASRQAANSANDRLLQDRQRVAVFNVGEAVMVERKDRKKLQPRYSGPYSILRIIDQNNFLLDMPGGEKPVHMSLLKKFSGDSKLAEPDSNYLESLKDDPDNWEVASDSDRNSFNANNIVGARIRVYWPKFRQWFDGIVLRRFKKQHEVYYWDISGNAYNERLIGYKHGTRWALLRPRTVAPDRGE